MSIFGCICLVKTEQKQTKNLIQIHINNLRQPPLIRDHMRIELRIRQILASRHQPLILQLVRIAVGIHQERRLHQMHRLLGLLVDDKVARVAHQGPVVGVEELLVGNAAEAFAGAEAEDGEVAVGVGGGEHVAGGRPLRVEQASVPFVRDFVVEFSEQFARQDAPDHDVAVVAGAEDEARISGMGFEDEHFVGVTFEKRCERIYRGS